MYIIERIIMEQIKKLLGSLYKGDKDSVTAAFTNALEKKQKEALEVKKVAIASEIFNKGQ